MSTTNSKVNRLSVTLVLNGGLFVVLGLGGVLWSEAFLIVAMLAVAAVASVLGIYEVWTAFTLRRQWAGWWVVLLHGIASIIFGMLTVGAPGVSLEAALVAVAAWFLFYAGIAWAGAGLAWRIRGVWWALATWGLLNFVLAILTVSYPRATIFALLYLGGWYAAMFGVWQLGAGLWLRRAARDPAVRPFEDLLVVVRT